MLNEKETMMNGQEQMPMENDPEAKKRKDALDLWRSLKDVNANLPEDLISDELTAASDASDLQTKSFGACWLRSRCPMPRVRISNGLSERLIPWYSILEIHVDAVSGYLKFTSPGMWSARSFPAVRRKNCMRICSWNGSK
jgi:hypothetical protein